MAIEIGKIQIGNMNSFNNSYRINNVSFTGESKPINNDTVEISTQDKKGLSNGAKVAIVFGTIAAIVGGILLHKHNSAKAVEQASEQAGNTIKQTTKELTQAVKDMVSQGRISQKEAEMFNQIHDLDGEEFVKKAYELIAKDMNLTKYPKLIVSLEDKGATLGHTGKDITIYIKGYEKEYGKENAKEEMINTIRHELEHYKQDLIVFLQKGDKPMQEAYQEHISRYIENQAILRGGTGADLGAVIKEEAERVGSKVRCGDSLDDLLQKMYEHDSPISTIRTMTPCDFEKLNLTQEELSKADEYLESLRSYYRVDFPKKYLKPDGGFDYDKLQQDNYVWEIFKSWADKGYYHNPIEEGARQAGEALKEKFKVFMEAMK